MYGDICKHMGWLDEGAIFMYIAPAEDGWTWVLVLRGAYNNWYEGRIDKANSALELVQ